MKVLTDLFIDGQLEVQDVVLFNTVPQASTDTDKFIVLDGNAVKYRTGAQLLSDIGAGTVTSVGLTTATTGVTIGGSPITTSGNITINIQNASGSQPGLLIASDWTTFNNKVSPTRAINTLYSIQGGGDLSTDRTLSLVGDTPSPGIDKYYGINGSGARGWYDFPAVGGSTVVVTLSRTVQTFNTTLGQTVFTVAGGYEVGTIDVHYNGSRLTSAEYVATNGTTVTLNFPAHRANDIVDIIEYGDGPPIIDGNGIVFANGTTITYLAGTSSQFVKGNGTLDSNTYLTANQTITLSGDVTGSGTTAITTTIQNNVVTLAKFQQIATSSFLGRVTAATGNVEVLTGSQATSLLDTFTSGAKGLVSASGGGTANFLRADGTWTLPVADGDKGDITVSASGATWTIDNTVVSYAKIQNVAANSFLANITGSSATVQEVSTSRIPLFASSITGTPSSTTYLRGDGSWASLPAETSNFPIIIDGGGSAITTGVKGDFVVPFNCTVTGWTILSTVSGSIVVDIWQDSYANFAPTVADTITGANKPTLVSQTKNQATGLSWSLTAGSILRINVDSASTATFVTVNLQVTKV